MEFFAGIGAGWMNLASLALGLLAWMLPVAAMIRTAARPRALHPALPLVCVSFAACAAALYLQLRFLWFRCITLYPPIYVRKQSSYRC